MRRVYIFAIGGTGSRVLRSLSMLLAAGINGMDSDLELVPVIIDYDVVNGDKNIATDCLDTYLKIHKSIAKDYKDDSFFMTGLSRLKDVATPGGQIGNDIRSQNFDIYFGPVTTNTLFSDEVQYNLMTGKLDLCHSLFEALYNDLPETDLMGNENKDTELNLNLKKGFKGNPNIGSVIFDKLKETEEFKHFQAVFNPATDKVFVISSIFGGTGSSGFPQIVNSIRFNNMPGVSGAYIGAVIVLPYFKIQPGAGAIDSNNFNSKTKAALSFYETSGLNNRLNTTYYIGDPETTQLGDHDGGNEQRNNAHLVELLSALSIIHFCRKPVNNNDHDAFEYGLSNNQTVLNLSNIYEEDKQIHFDYLTRFAYMMKYYRDVLEGKRNKIKSNESFYAGLRLSDKITKDAHKDLEHFISLFEKWLDELQNNAHQFKPYHFDSNEKITRFLSDKPLEENRLLPDALTDADITKWMNNAFTKEKPSLTPDKEGEVFFRIMRKTSLEILNKVLNLKASKQ